MAVTGKWRLKVLGGIENDRTILSTNEDGHWVSLAEENDGSGRQVWEIKEVPNTFGIYHITVTATLTNKRKYLSRNGWDGVDLWERDDNEGRQTWEIKPIGNGLYHIINRQTKRYLSASPDGNKIEVYKEDEKNGRQQWMLANPTMDNWMHDNIQLLGDKQLNQVCIPSSHDASLGELTHISRVAAAGNTQTQTKTILEQLKLGVRHFDIRPSIRNGVFSTSHVTRISQIQDLRDNPRAAFDRVMKAVDDAKIFVLVRPAIAIMVGAIIIPELSKMNLYQGGDGQSLESVIKDINEYTKTGKDLVIINSSHTMNLDKEKPFNDEDHKKLWKELAKINNLYVLPESHTGPIDLNKFKVNDFIKDGPKVILRIDDGKDVLGDYHKRGFYRSDEFPIYDSYSGTLDIDRMMKNQIDNLKSHSGSGSTDAFLLAWTLTLDESTAVVNTVFRLLKQYTGVNIEPIARKLKNVTILDFTNEPRRKVWTQINQAMAEHKAYPNLLSADNHKFTHYADCAMGVNLQRLG